MKIQPYVRDVDRPPLAIKEDGSWWQWRRHHTGIIGTTGSGKNSPITSMLYHDEPLIRQGLVAPYAFISPKDEDLMKLQYTTLVKEFATEDPIDQAIVLGEVYNTMLKRVQYNKWVASLTVAEKEQARREGRLRTIVPKHLVIDEFNSEFENLKTATIPNVLFRDVNKKTGEVEEKPATGEQIIKQILRKGRSPKVFLTIASQGFNIEDIGKRENYQWWIFLRIMPSNKDWIDRAFGPGSLESGIRPDLIPQLNPDGSTTAGVAFVKEDGGDHTRVRFPYASNAMFDKIVARNRVEIPYVGPTDFSDLE